MLCVLHVILFQSHVTCFIICLTNGLAGCLFPSVIVYWWFLLLASYEGKTNMFDSRPFKIQLFFLQIIFIKKSFICLLQKKKCCSLTLQFLFIKDKKIYIFSTEIEAAQLLSTFYNNQKCLLSSILEWFWRSCDTDAEISVCKLHLIIFRLKTVIYSNEMLQYYCFTIFWSNTCSLKLFIRDLKEKTLSIPNFRMLALRAN